MALTLNHANRRKLARKLNAKEDREQLLADLAWDYQEKVQSGDTVQLEDYLKKCPDDAARKELTQVVNMSAFVQCAAQFPEH